MAQIREECQDGCFEKNMRLSSVSGLLNLKKWQDIVGEMPFADIDDIVTPGKERPGL